MALADDIAALPITPASGGTTHLADSATLHAAAKSHETRVTANAAAAAAETVRATAAEQANTTAVAGKEPAITRTGATTGQVATLQAGGTLAFAPGAAGTAATVTTGTTTTGAAGTSATVTNSGTASAAVLNFVVPQGVAGVAGTAGTTGTAGTPGSAATVTTGTTTTGAAGTSATVTNSGTASAAVLNFVVPQGVAGVAGTAGTTGTAGTPGSAATVTTGTTTTGAAGTSATVTNSGTASAAVLNFVVPQGVAGSGATNATATAVGSVQLAGDLAGTATAPTVPGKEALISRTGATAGQVATLQAGGTLAFATPAAGGGGFTIPMKSGAYHFNAASNGYFNSAFAPTVGTLYAVPFYVTATTTFVTLTTSVGTVGAAGALLRLGLYTVAATGGIGTLVVDGGTVDCTTSNDKSATINVALTPGMYFAVEVCNDATVRIRALGQGPIGNSLSGLGSAGGPVQMGGTYLAYTGYAAGSAFPATGSTAGYSIQSGDIPIVALKAA